MNIVLLEYKFELWYFCNDRLNRYGKMCSFMSHILRHKCHTGAYSVKYCSCLWMVCLQHALFLCSPHLPLASRPVGRWMCRHLGLISVLSGMLIQFPVAEELYESDSLVGKHQDELSQAHSFLFPFLFWIVFVYLSVLLSDHCLIMFRCMKHSIVDAKMEIILYTHPHVVSNLYDIRPSSDNIMPTLFFYL